MERFLYRLARSPHADRFILKGALLLTAWRAPLSRPTMDIDRAGKTDNQLDNIGEIVAAGVSDDLREAPSASGSISECGVRGSAKVEVNITLATRVLAKSRD